MPTAQARAPAPFSAAAAVASSLPPLHPHAAQYVVLSRAPTATEKSPTAHFYSERFTTRAVRLLRRILRAEWQHLAYRLRAPAWPLSDPTDFAIWSDGDRAVYAMFVFSNEYRVCSTLHCVATVVVDPDTKFVSRLEFHAPFGPLGCAYDAALNAKASSVPSDALTPSPASSPVAAVDDGDFLSALPSYCPVLTAPAWIAIPYHYALPRPPLSPYL